MMPPPEQPVPGGLLIVDDRPEVLKAVERLLAIYFEPVYAAHTPPEAEALLKAHSPRFLLCDYWLGEDWPPATAIIPRWRREYPCLQRVALMTGTNSASIPPCAAVEFVFTKPLDTARVVAFYML
jgi:CheY-like chemotaxis protein